MRKRPRSRSIAATGRPGSPAENPPMRCVPKTRSRFGRHAIGGLAVPSRRHAHHEPHRGGFSFGLGVAVRTSEGLSSVPGNPGEFTWNGAYGTQFFCDPKERLVVVVGTAAPGELRKYYREQVQDIVYGAIVR